MVAVVVDMEQKSGFFELVRRVGASSRSRRFGKGFQVWSRPGEDQLGALSIHACGAFEDWVYHLFQEPGGMNKPGNRKLYNLLGEIRLRLQARIRNILVNAYSCAPLGEAGAEQSWLFGGCYFAATGETEDRQAFVRDVFRRMIDLQDEVEWSDRALRRTALPAAGAGGHVRRWAVGPRPDHAAGGPLSGQVVAWRPGPRASLPARFPARYTAGQSNQLSFGGLVRTTPGGSRALGRPLKHYA